jgi:hypothetical protein
MSNGGRAQELGLQFQERWFRQPSGLGPHFIDFSLLRKRKDFVDPCLQARIGDNELLLDSRLFGREVAHPTSIETSFERGRFRARRFLASRFTSGRT